MSMNKIRSLFISAALLVLAFFAMQPDFKRCSNVLGFITWLFFTMIFLGGCSKEVRERSIKQYQDPKGPHLPVWMDSIIYTILVITLAAGGWYWSATAWTHVAFTDIGYAKLAKEKGEQSK